MSAAVHGRSPVAVGLPAATARPISARHVSRIQTTRTGRMAPTSGSGESVDPRREAAAGFAPRQATRRPPDSHGWPSRRRCPAGPASERLVPADGEPERGVNHADHAVGLDEVPPLLPGGGFDVFGEQAVTVAAAEDVLEQRTRLVAAADRGERVDEPERAHQERVLRRAEVIHLDVAEYEVAALELALDGDDRAREARVVRGEEAQLAEPQQARIQGFPAVHRGHEARAPGIPRALEDDAAHAVGVPAPVRSAL